MDLAHGPGAASFDRILALVWRSDKVPSSNGPISGRKVTGGHGLAFPLILM